jgi:phenylalanyl-tRNA synthetase beta chain
MGVVSPIVRKKFDIKQEVYFAEIDFDQLVKMTKKSKVQFKELSKFPEVKRDLALLVDKNVTFSQLRSIAFATEKKLLKSVSLFDVYEGDKLPEGKKSYALSFILEDKSQTLTDKQIERTMANIQAQLEQKTGAEIRKLSQHHITINATLDRSFKVLTDLFSALFFFTKAHNPTYNNTRGCTRKRCIP